MASLLLEVGVALTVLAAAGSVAVRLGQSVIPAYIVAGIVVGPHGPSIAGVSLAVVRHGEFVDAIAELGIVLLLFFLGLEFSPDQLLGNWRRLTTYGLLDLAVNFTLGLGLGFLLGLDAVGALFVAGIVYISSSAVVTKTLADLGWLADPETEVVLGVLVFEDLAIAVYLAALGALVLGGGGPTAAAVSVAKAFAFLGVLVAVARYGTGWIERAFDAESGELFLLRVVGVTTLVAAVALAAGISEAVAAFFVGAALSETTHVPRIETVVAPARDLFAAVFFFAIGLTTDVGLLRPVLGFLGVAVVVSVLGKLATGAVCARWAGLGRRRAVRVGTGLVPRGEFSLVLAALAASAGTGALATLVPAFAVGYVLVMSLLGTVLMRYADEIAAAVGSAAPRPG